MQKKARYGEAQVVRENFQGKAGHRRNWEQQWGRFYSMSFKAFNVAEEKAKPGDGFLYRQDGPVAKSEKTTTKNKHWLHRDLRVRFIDKLHKGGRYYNTKV